MKMKKIMLGLMAMGAMSAVATAAAIVPTNPAVNDTVIFDNTQTGKIAVQGKLVGKTAAVKYAIFATTDEGKANKEDTLVLTDFVLSQDAGTNVFKGVNPKVMVKKVNGAATEDLTNENIEFKVAVDPYYTQAPAEWFGEGKKVEFYPTTFISNADMIVISNELTALGKGDYVLRPNGLMGIENHTATPNNYYKTPNKIKWEQTAKGVLEVGTIQDSGYNSYLLAPEQIALVEAKFSSGRNFGNTFVHARIK